MQKSKQPRTSATQPFSRRNQNPTRQEKEEEERQREKKDLADKLLQQRALEAEEQARTARLHALEVPSASELLKFTSQVLTVAPGAITSALSSATQQVGKKLASNLDAQVINRVHRISSRWSQKPTTPEKEEAAKKHAEQLEEIWRTQNRARMKFYNQAAENEAKRNEEKRQQEKKALEEKLLQQKKALEEQQLQQRKALEKQRVLKEAEQARRAEQLYALEVARVKATELKQRKELEAQKEALRIKAEEERKDLLDFAEDPDALEIIRQLEYEDEVVFSPAALAVVQQELSVQPETSASASDVTTSPIRPPNPKTP